MFNIWEHLFSTAGYALSQKRKRMLPVNLESLLFLHLNKDLLGISEVSEPQLIWLVLTCRLPTLGLRQLVRTK